MFKCFEIIFGSTITVIIIMILADIRRRSTCFRGTLVVLCEDFGIGVDSIKYTGQSLLSTIITTVSSRPVVTLLFKKHVLVSRLHFCLAYIDRTLPTRVC